MQTHTERPPYVTFGYKDVEDRTESLKQGHYVSRDVPFVFITPAGTKDRIERVAEDWFKDITERVRAGRFQQAWVAHYKAQYSAWIAGEEPVLNGTPLRYWPGVSPSQYRMLQELKILTVEDLAAANEETISRAGMGARLLKNKAIEWLQSAEKGVAVERVVALEESNRTMAAQIERLVAKNAELAAMVSGAGMALPGAAVETSKGGREAPAAAQAA